MKKKKKKQKTKKMFSDPCMTITQYLWEKYIMKQTTGYLVIILNDLYFTSHSGISISGNCNSACILWGIFICIAVFSVSTRLWNSHNINEDFQILRSVQIPVPFLLFFFFKHIALFPVCWCIWHMSDLEVSGVPLIWKSSMWAWKSFVFSRWIAISVRSNLLTLLFKCSLELLDFICCVY